MNKFRNLIKVRKEKHNMEPMEGRNIILQQVSNLQMYYTCRRSKYLTFD